MSLHHSFDINIASEYGVHEAIIIHHFMHWIRYNRSLERNYIEGRTWTYQTIEEIAAHFPYLNISQVRDVIEKLCSGKPRKSKKESLCFEPVLIKGNFNKSSYDRTVWYAFVDEEKFLPKCILGKPQMEEGFSPNGIRENPKTIPHTIPDNKPKIVCPTAPVGPPGLQKTIKKFGTDGKENSLDLDDVFRQAIQLRKDWSSLEINEAWQILCSYEGRVNDLWQFIMGTIDNLRAKFRLEKLKASSAKEEKKCHYHMGQAGRLPTQEELDMLKRPSPLQDYLNQTKKGSSNG